MPIALTPLALFVLAYLQDVAAAQYAAIPRWGQAVALVQDVLYIHGGRTDPYNQFSYTSAPVNNDLFSLSLSSPFNPSSPSFEYVGGCSNCSASQGPAVAWHTLTPFNTTSVLLFGGATGPSTPTILPDGNDSAVLLDVTNEADPSWSFEAQSWADEPMRRIHHTAISAGGKVWIVGGEKADDSGSAFSQHYVFDPQQPSFSPLPSTDGPPDITGHQSIVLSDGRMLVFGGYSPSENSLISFSTIWSMDTTQSNPSWTTVSVSSTNLPSPRRAFSAALVDSGQILIQGGADALLQNSLQDGWVLDTTQSPMVWSNISVLSQLGPRRDHFAVGLGTVVIFGFGYAQNGPASATLEIFNVSSGEFITDYTPPPAVTSPTTTTLPASDPSGTFVPGSAEIPFPSHTHGSGGGNGSSSTAVPGSGPSSVHDDSQSHGTIIALSTVFGVLGLAAGTSIAVWYVRRRRSTQSFHRLDASADEETPATRGPIPMAGMRNAAPLLLPVVRTMKDRLSKVVPGMATSQPSAPERRDMLADEDTREFYTGPWYMVRRDPSSGQSSRVSGRRPTLDRIYDSLSSLRSAGGAMLDYAAGIAAAGARSMKSREPSTGSKSSTWQTREKQGSFDPYADDAGLVRYGAPSLPAARPRGGRQASSYSYKDPFEDYEVESLDYDPEIAYRDESDDERIQGFPSLLDPPPRTKLQSPATLDLTRLTPLSDHPSVPTLTDPSSASSASLSAAPRSSFAASGSSHEPHSPTSPKRPSSILDANPPIAQSMRRSNSWWTRFAKTPLLDRALSTDSNKSRKPLDFRDPNPPPRLITIEESTHSNSADSPEGRQKSRSGSGGRQRSFYNVYHGRSASSLQTARTADTDMMERMANTMQIVQRDSSSSRSGPSRGPSGEDDVSLGGADPPHVPNEPARGGQLTTILGSPSRDTNDPIALVQSPTEMTREEALGDIGSAPTRTSSARSPPGSNVAERVQAYERRMSQMQENPRSPGLAPRARPSGYGLAPKPSLFIVNPDYRHSSSSSS